MRIIIASALVIMACHSQIPNSVQTTASEELAVVDTLPVSIAPVQIVKDTMLPPKIEEPQKTTASFQQAFEEINLMLSGQQAQDLKRAVFLVENAWHGGTLSYKTFCGQISEIVETMRQMAKNKGIAQYQTAGNWAAHTYLCRPVPENNNQPYLYDFEDPLGDTNLSNTFVTRLLDTRKGTCRSLPLLYNNGSLNILCGDSAQIV